MGWPGTGIMMRVDSTEPQAWLAPCDVMEIGVISLLQASAELSGRAR